MKKTYYSFYELELQSQLEVIRHNSRKTYEEIIGKINKAVVSEINKSILRKYISEDITTPFQSIKFLPSTYILFSEVEEDEDYQCFSERNKAELSMNISFLGMDKVKIVSLDDAFYVFSKAYRDRAATLYMIENNIHFNGWFSKNGDRFILSDNHIERMNKFLILMNIANTLQLTETYEIEIDERISKPLISPKSKSNESHLFNMKPETIIKWYNERYSPMEIPVRRALIKTIEELGTSMSAKGFIEVLYKNLIAN